MSRSVETVRNAEAVVFLHFEYPEDELDAQYEWDGFVDGISDTLRVALPSLEPDDEWLPYPFRETRVFLSNRMAKVTISEYCGMVAICLVPRTATEEYWPGYGPSEGMQRHWIAQVEGKVRRVLKDSGFTVCRKVGTFSNGEAVYERVA